MNTHSQQSSDSHSAPLSDEDVSRIIEMAWEDRTTFEAIRLQFGLLEKDVIALMRRQMKPSSFAMWRKRVSGRSTKHARLRSPDQSADDALEFSEIARNKTARNEKVRFVSANQKTSPRRRK
jgi:uncharacterized protein (TIGR03643 family)